MKVLGFKVPDDIYATFEQEAVNLGLTKSDLLRILVNRFLEVKQERRKEELDDCQ